MTTERRSSVASETNSTPVIHLVVAQEANRPARVWLGRWTTRLTPSLCAEVRSPLLIRSTCEHDGLSPQSTAPRSAVVLGLDEAYAWPGAVVLASLGTTGGMGRGAGTGCVCFE